MTTPRRLDLATFDEAQDLIFEIVRDSEWVAAEPGTIALYLLSLRMLLDFIGLEPNVAPDPRVKKPKQVREEPQPPSAEQYLAILEAIGPKWRLLFITIEQGAPSARRGHLAALGRRRRRQPATTPAALGDQARPGPFRLPAAVVHGGNRGDLPARGPRAGPARVPGDHGGLGLPGDESCLRNAKVPHYSPHDLRHRRVTIWHQSGVPARELAERAGHARASMSLDVYSHVLPPDEVAAERLQTLIE